MIAKIKKTPKPNGSYPKLKNTETRATYHKRLAVSIYDRLYRIQSGGKYFASPAMINEMKAYGTGKWIQPFAKVVKFLIELRGQNQAANPMAHLLNDYFTLVLNHYSQFKRYPTVKQLNGPTIESKFISYVHKEEDDKGEYWSDQDLYDRIKFSNRYGFGERTYDPLFPELWDGPGDPKSVPSLNSGKAPIKIGFIDLVKHNLIKAPIEDIHEYYRLYEPNVPREEWITGEVPERIGNKPPLDKAKELERITNNIIYKDSGGHPPIKREVIREPIREPIKREVIREQIRMEVVREPVREVVREPVREVHAQQRIQDTIQREIIRSSN
jgi:hypothetical protein